MPIPFIDLKSTHKRVKDKIDHYFNEVIENTAFIYGPIHQDCEEKLAEFAGTKHCVAYSSGSDAILATLMAMDIKPGDEVITTCFSFFATVSMMHYCGVKPVLVDISENDYNIDVAKIEAAITPKTKAIMPVSLYGQTPDFDAIKSIAQKHKLWVIEDGAQSYGAKYKGKMSCALTDAACTSFYPAKPLGCYGDGGACFTNNDEWAHALRQIREHGSDVKYSHARIGMNGRFDALQAAVVLAKLDIFEEECELRSQAGARYNKLFAEAGLSSLKTPAVNSECRHIYAQYTVRVPNRDQLQKKLMEKGIPTAIHYPIPMHQQKAFIDTWGAQGPFPVAEMCAKEVLSLPMHPYIREDDQIQVVEAFKSSL